MTELVDIPKEERKKKKSVTRVARAMLMIIQDPEENTQQPTKT